METIGGDKLNVYLVAEPLHHTHIMARGEIFGEPIAKPGMMVGYFICPKQVQFTAIIFRKEGYQYEIS
jgi:hypothetical protein